MSQEFSRVKVATNKKSSFDMSHHQITSSDFGKIIPIAVRECVPDDQINIDPQVFIRLAPLAVPTFGHIKARIHTFFVPNRIMWRNWDKFIDGTSSSTLPYLTTLQLQDEAVDDPAYIGYADPVTPYARGQITDLFTNLGLSQEVVYNYHTSTKNYKLSPFPFLAYQRVWFDYFRDSNLNQDESWFDQFRDHISGQYSNTIVHQMVQLRRACFKKDYFTTAKLNPQDGTDASVASVDFLRSQPSSGSSSYAIYGTTTNNSKKVDLNWGSSISAVNSLFPSISVPVLRAATALQRYLERNNFVGARHISRLLAHFGIAPTAERLDMAEYLGGNDFPVQIADVTSTSIRDVQGTTPFDTSGLGTQAGKGIAAGNGKGISYHAKEHGILISVLSILPDTGYYQGLPKMFTRGYNGDGKFEFFHSEFENLSFQPILTRELISNASNPDLVFGYTPKYSDYKFQKDVLAGDLVARGTNTGTDSYHLFRWLDSSAQLNTDFTECGYNSQLEYDRIFQFIGDGEDHFYINVNCRCNMIRPMDSFTAPSIINSEEGDGKRVDLPYGGIRL